jgi:hypothetical protein
MDAPAVADGAVAEYERPCEWRAVGGGAGCIVERDRGVERGEMAAEFVHGAEAGDAGI